MDWHSVYLDLEPCSDLIPSSAAQEPCNIGRVSRQLWVSLSPAKLCSWFRLLKKLFPSLRFGDVVSGPSVFPIFILRKILDSPNRCFRGRGGIPIRICRILLPQLLKHNKVLGMYSVSHFQWTCYSLVDFNHFRFNITLNLTEHVRIHCLLSLFNLFRFTSLMLKLFFRILHSWWHILVN